MTDRFADGDKSNDGDADPTRPERFHGGDWQGLIDHLDDLKDLGVTALWISPVIANDRDFFGADGYHGYWPHDFYQTEKSFGSMEKLQELVRKAHEKGLKVIFDTVLNHTGYNHPWAKDPAHEDWFHHDGVGLEDMSLYGLPDLAQEKPKVAQYLIDVGKYWADQTGADGYRLDAVMHMPISFVQKFGEEMKADRGQGFFIVGEAYKNDPAVVARYQNQARLDSAFDYPLANTIRNVVGKDEHRGLWGRWREYMKLRRSFPGEASRILRPGDTSARQFHNLFEQDGAYRNPNAIATLIENHDMPRFMSMAGENARQKFQLAQALMFTFRGIPCVYYGAEDGMGMAMEDMRADKRDGADPDMRAFIKSLAHMRQDSVALRRGEQHELLCDRDVYAFSRVHPQQTVVVAANVSGREQRRDIPLLATRRSSRIRNLLTGETFSIPGNTLQVKLPPEGICVLEVLA